MRDIHDGPVQSTTPLRASVTVLVRLNKSDCGTKWTIMRQVSILLVKIHQPDKS